MEIDDTLYKAFLGEVEALDKFRITYTGEHPRVPLGREDQDVRRLIEAMAMLTTRARLAGQRAIAQSTLRLFRQHFPYVLSPVPSMAMLAPRIEARFAEATEIPRGAEVVVTPMIPPGAPKEGVTPARAFRTLFPNRVLPIALTDVELFRLESSGAFRLLVYFESGFSRNEALGRLSLHVDHLGDFVSSAAVHYALREHTQTVSVFYDQKVPEGATGQPCGLDFGPPRSPPESAEPYDETLQRARCFFHFPQQELYVNVELPAPPRNWQRFTLCFDLKPTWPASLRLTPDTLRLHTVPVINLRRDMASPMEHDGTHERHLVSHPDSGSGWTPALICGVFRLDGKGLVPMRPGVVKGGPGTYEVEHEGHGTERKNWVAPEIPSAFREPVGIAVEALWHQPSDLDEPLDYDVGFSDRYDEGLLWRVLGRVLPGHDNRLDEQRDGLMHLLSIRSQRFLEQPDLRFLLEALGVAEERHFADLVRALSGAEVRVLPYARTASGFKYIYDLTFDDLDAAMLPVLDLFCRRLLEVLRAWSAEEVVELNARLPSLERELMYDLGGKK